MSRSRLIKDTTREERIRIVQEALSWGDDCDSVSGLMSSVDQMYQPYIEASSSWPSATCAAHLPPTSRATAIVPAPARA